MGEFSLRQASMVLVLVLVLRKVEEEVWVTRRQKGGGGTKARKAIAMSEVSVMNEVVGQRDDHGWYREGVDEMTCEVCSALAVARM